MIKDIVIREMKKENMREGFYITILFQDMEEMKQTVGPFTIDEKPYLIRFLNMLEDCLHAFPYGKCSGDKYEDYVDDLHVWDISYYDDRAEDETEEEEMMEKEPEFYNFTRELGFAWKLIPEWYEDATIKSYEVQYFDGMQFHDTESVREE